MKTEFLIAGLTAQAVKDLYGLEIDESSVQVQKTRKEFEGHLTVVVFPYLKSSRKGPEQTAAEIGEWIKSNTDAVSGYNVIKGFLNLLISRQRWVETLNEINSDTAFGMVKAADDAPLVMIEYSSPNTNKPLHLGHVRNNLLGSALSNIIAANGCRVVKTNIVNDRGIHICKSMLAWLKWGNGATPESTGMKGDHLVGDYYVEFDKRLRTEIDSLLPAGYDEMDEKAKDAAKAEAEKTSPLMQEVRAMLVQWEAGDPDVCALWKKMNGWVYEGFDETYRRLGVSFDKIYYESETYLEGKEAVMEGLKRDSFSAKMTARYGLTSLKRD